jgi:hypothetical protein
MWLRGLYPGDLAQANCQGARLPNGAAVSYSPRMFKVVQG